MKIVTTFIEGLYAFWYDQEETNELYRLMDLWNDPVYLDEFFEENKADLGYFHLDVESAIYKTIEEANDLDDTLYDMSDNRQYSLDLLFQPLNDLELKPSPLSKQKAKPKRSWLRLYALKIDSGHFVITGGAIKLTHKMQDRVHTRKELTKLETCRSYLRSQGVFDSDSFNELEM